MPMDGVYAAYRMWSDRFEAIGEERHEIEEKLNDR